MYAETKQSHSIPSNELFRCPLLSSLEIIIFQCITPKINAWMIRPYNNNKAQERNNNNWHCIK